MHNLNINVLKHIEKALDVKFYDWQLAYLLKQPMLLDLKTTGRCTGKTLTYIIELLFMDDSILDLSKYENAVEHCDWWSVEKHKERIKSSSYPSWFVHNLKTVYIMLNEKGIKTRIVIFDCGKRNEKPIYDEHHYFRINKNNFPIKF